MLFKRKSLAAERVCSALSGVDYGKKLERALYSMFGRKTLPLSSADAAIHTALYLCGARDGDYVFVPTFTFYTYVRTVSNIGCVPVFIDCDPSTRCVSPAALETAFVWAKLQNKPPKAVIVDDAFGSVPDYDALSPLCKSFDVPLIELACDALGGSYKGTPCGANGDYGVIGFGKRLGGGGGALVVGDDMEKARCFSRGAYTDGESYDYRLHDVVAALDLSVLPDLTPVLARCRRNLAALAAADLAVKPVDGDAAAYAVVRSKEFASIIRKAGFDVKTPPSVRTMSGYSGCAFFEHEPNFCVSDAFSDCCLVSTDFSLARRLKLERILKKLVR